MRNFTDRVRPWILALGAAALCTACATPGVKPASSSTDGASSTAERESGFLSDYSLLKPASGDPAYRVYVSSPGIARQYRKFIIDVPEVLVDTAGQFQVLDPSRVTDVTSYYRTAMATALGHHYQVVTQPGPGVARLRVAVVGAVEVNPALKLRDAIPVTAIFKVARAAAGKNPQLLRMSVESELLDSQDGRLLAAMVDSREGARSVPKDEPTSFDQLHELVDYWIDRFVAKLDKANGFTQ